MFNRIKHWLGIESIKIKLLLPPEQPIKGILQGKVVFTSMTDQKVESLTITLYEYYTKGRKKRKEKQTFELGTISLEKRFTVPKDQKIKIAFKLHYQNVHSEMDELADGNVLLKGVTKAAKFVGNIQSTYELVAEANVQGGGLNPFDKLEVILA